VFEAQTKIKSEVTYKGEFVEN